MRTTFQSWRVADFSHSAFEIIVGRSISKYGLDNGGRLSGRKSRFIQHIARGSNTSKILFKQQSTCAPRWLHFEVKVSDVMMHLTSIKQMRCLLKPPSTWVPCRRDLEARVSDVITPDRRGSQPILSWTAPKLFMRVPSLLDARYSPNVVRNNCFSNGNHFISFIEFLCYCLVIKLTSNMQINSVATPDLVPFLKNGKPTLNANIWNQG